MKRTSFVKHSLLIAPYYSPSAVYCSSYRKLDSKCDSETLVPSQPTTGFVTENNKIRIFAVVWTSN